MTTQLRQTIDELTFSQDLDGLGDLLIQHEDDDDARECLYAAIDNVAWNLDQIAAWDGVWVLS